ncbi:hypothetical protein BHM03_00056008 [Ensete ventricosum]|nr:hypothetical protein BHM03_00056008 [Ensete ventricosum]
MPRPTAPSVAIRALAPKKLHETSFANDRPKDCVGIVTNRGAANIAARRALMIEPVEDEDNEPFEEGLEPEEEATEEEPQPADYAVHALANYSNPQTMKVGGLLKQQPITVLIDTGSTNNFLNSKVAACLALQIKGCKKFDVKVVDDRILNCDQRCPRVKLLL